MQQNDVEYYVRRERAERQQAARASDSGARHAHLAMADVYAERLRTITSTPAIPLR